MLVLVCLYSPWPSWNLFSFVGIWFPFATSLRQATCSASGPITGPMTLGRSLVLLEHLLNDLLGPQCCLTLRALSTLFHGNGARRVA